MYLVPPESRVTESFQLRLERAPDRNSAAHPPLLTDESCPDSHMKSGHRSGYSQLHPIRDLALRAGYVGS
jgi:hypothetical protein